MKTKRIFYNLVVGVFGQVIAIILGLLLPRYFIGTFGSEINGIVNTVTQIYVYINLLEAGVGTATIQALYKPISSDNKQEINSILSATSNYYKKTGILYLLAVFVFAFSFPFLFKTTVDNFTIFCIVLFSGLGGVINFFFQGKYRLLLEAEGKSYIISSLTTSISIISTVIKIILIIKGFNVIAVQFSFFVINLLQVFVIGRIIQKSYKWIDLKVSPNYNAISQKNSVLIHQVSFMVFSNTDVLLLSMFIGFKIVSVYSLYALIFRTVSTLLSIANNSAAFALGQVFHKDIERFKKLIDTNEFVFFVLSFSAFTSVYIVIIEFMKLYTRGPGFSDINYIDKNLAFMFMAIEVLKSVKPVMNSVVNVSGHFKQTTNRAILEMIINLVVSLICVNIFGVYGVLIGTVCALLYRSNDFVLYVNKKILNRSPLKSYARWIFNIILCVLIVYLTRNIHISSSSYIEFLKGGIIIFTLVTSVFVILNSILFKSDLKVIIDYIKLRTRKNLS